LKRFECRIKRALAATMVTANRDHCRLIARREGGFAQTIAMIAQYLRSLRRAARLHVMDEGLGGYGWFRHANSDERLAAGTVGRSPPPLASAQCEAKLTGRVRRDGLILADRTHGHGDQRCDRKNCEQRVNRPHWRSPAPLRAGRFMS